MSLIDQVNEAFDTMEDNIPIDPDEYGDVVSYRLARVSTKLDLVCDLLKILILKDEDMR